MRKVSQRVVEEFDAAARSWGWQRDQGVGSEVGHSLDQYEESKDRLVARIEYLEKIAFQPKRRKDAK